jgi:hypothetical protein
MLLHYHLDREMRWFIHVSNEECLVAPRLYRQHSKHISQNVYHRLLMSDTTRIEAYHMT